MPSKSVYEILDIYRHEIEKLPPEKRHGLEKILEELDTREMIAYMDMQAEMFATGLISKDVALLLYNTIKDWDHADLASRYFTAKLMAEYAQIKLNKHRELTRKRVVKTHKKTNARKTDGSNYEIVATTPRFDGGNGGKPFRFVVLKWNKGDRIVYSRHMEVGDGEFYYGHYYSNKQDAVNDMKRSFEEEYVSGTLLKEQKKARNLKTAHRKRQIKKKTK